MHIIVVFLIGVCLIELHGENVVCLCMKQSCQLYFSPLYLDKSVNYHPQREALCYVLTSFEGLLSSSFVSYFIWSVAGHWHYVRTDSTTIPTRFYSRSGLKLNAVRISVVCHHVSLLNRLNFSCVQFRFGCSVGCYSSFELASVLRWTLVTAARRARRRVGSAAGLLVPLPQSGFFLMALHDTMIHLKCFMTLRETLTLCDRCRPSTLSAGITKGSSSCAVTRTAAWRCGTSETPPSHSRSPSLTVRHKHSHNPRDKSWVCTLCIDLNIIDCKQTSVDHMLSSDLPSSSWLCLCFSQCNQPPFSLIHQHSCSVTCTFRVDCAVSSSDCRVCGVSLLLRFSTLGEICLLFCRVSLRLPLMQGRPNSSDLCFLAVSCNLRQNHKAKSRQDVADGEGGTAEFQQIVYLSDI